MVVNYVFFYNNFVNYIRFQGELLVVTFSVLLIIYFLCHYSK